MVEKRRKIVIINLTTIFCLAKNQVCIFLISHHSFVACFCDEIAFRQDQILFL